MDDFPKAAVMRSLIDSALSTAAQSQVLDIRTRIHNAVSQGRSSITVYVFQPGVKEFLEAKGYQVERHAALDQRDSDMYEVSW